MRMAILTLAFMAGGALEVFAHESRVRLNPYAGWYHFDEGSFEEDFDTSETESDPIYGLRLGIGTGKWTLDLAYGVHWPFEQRRSAHGRRRHPVTRTRRPPHS